MVIGYGIATLLVEIDAGSLDGFLTAQTPGMDLLFAICQFSFVIWLLTPLQTARAAKNQTNHTIPIPLPHPMQRDVA